MSVISDRKKQKNHIINTVLLVGYLVVLLCHYLAAKSPVNECERRPSVERHIFFTNFKDSKKFTNFANFKNEAKISIYGRNCCIA